MTHERPNHDLPVADDGTVPVPVFDCRVILSAPDENGVIEARVANLAGITASGRNEREILQRIVKDFKAALIRYRSDGVEVPWESPQSPGSEERQRWIPVHL